MREEFWDLEMPFLDQLNQYPENLIIDELQASSCVWYW